MRLHLAVCAVIAAVRAAVVHVCVPFSDPSAAQAQSRSRFELATGRNASVLVYNRLLVLNTNGPYVVDDVGIHRYSSHEDFTVCGLDQFEGGYCNVFGHFTLRSTLTPPDETNPSAHYSWRDTFDWEAYGSLVVSNEFVKYDEGNRSYEVPYAGTWCVAAYQDGLYLSQISIRWAHPWGSLSLYEWRVWNAQWWSALVEFGLVLWLWLLRKADDVPMTNFTLSLALYHTLGQLHFWLKNSDHDWPLAFLALFTASLCEAYVVHMLSYVLNTTPTTGHPLRKLLLLRAMASLSDHWILQLMHLLLTLAVIHSIYRLHTKNNPSRGRQRRSLLLIVCGIPLIQDLLRLVRNAAMLASVSVRDKTLFQKLVVLGQDCEARGPLGWLYVMTSFTWMTVMAYLALDRVQSSRNARIE